MFLIMPVRQREAMCGTGKAGCGAGGGPGKTAQAWNKQNKDDTDTVQVNRTGNWMMRGNYAPYVTSFAWGSFYGNVWHHGTAMTFF